MGGARAGPVGGVAHDLRHPGLLAVLKLPRAVFRDVNHVLGPRLVHADLPCARLRLLHALFGLTPRQPQRLRVRFALLGVQLAAELVQLDALRRHQLLDARRLHLQACTLLIALLLPLKGFFHVGIVPVLTYLQLPCYERLPVGLEGEEEGPALGHHAIELHLLRLQLHRPLLNLHMPCLHQLRLALLQLLNLLLQILPVFFQHLCRLLPLQLD
mmetsp:Transcript_2049/g.3507  ORF Transcript_2049/g.3507 Transcript_2049/m.3507 type:complete len:214 (+) Transcript_2049:244-885(+)